MTLSSRIATASMSREIFLAVGNTDFPLLSCFAAPASSRRIHPPAFGLPPFGLKGRRFDGQAKRLIHAKLECPMQDIHLKGGTCLLVSSICKITNRMLLFAAKPLDLNSLTSILNSFPVMQPLREGARQSRRMDAAQPRGLNSLHSILNSFFTATQKPALRFPEVRVFCNPANQNPNLSPALKRYFIFTSALKFRSASK